MLKRTLIMLVGILLATATLITVGILIPAGVFKNIRPHAHGDFKKIPIPIPGPEDISFDKLSGYAFISVDDRRANLQVPGSVEGGIFIYNPFTDQGLLKNITPSTIKDFHPHGISLWRSPDGRSFLFAVSHRQKEKLHVVERFEWRNDSLVHLESISDADVMSSPNDIVAVGERSFYVTNDHKYPEEGLDRTLEDYLQRAISYVNYFDGKQFRTVAEDIAYANGINVSADGKLVYVAATTGRKLLTYLRNTATGALEKIHEKDLATGVDNIELDANGDLWIGCHPQLLKFVAHAKDSTKKSPSQVLKLHPLTSGDYDVEEVFLNNGKDYSGSTVAAPFDGVWLMGSVFENCLIVCSSSEKKHVD